MGLKSEKSSWDWSSGGLEILDLSRSSFLGFYFLEPLSTDFLDFLSSSLDFLDLVSLGFLVHRP